jgi:hypothetical protein
LKDPPVLPPWLVGVYGFYFLLPTWCLDSGFSYRFERYIVLRICACCKVYFDPVGGKGSHFLLPHNKYLNPFIAVLRDASFSRHKHTSDGFDILMAVKNFDFLLRTSDV